MDPRVAVLLGAIVVLSGCLSHAGSAVVFHGQGTAPVVMPPAGTPYDGTGMSLTQGNMEVHVFDANNTGYVDVTVVAPDGKYEVHWSNFSDQPNSPWQDGGIACGPGLIEHGASGHGNKMEPQFDLLCGGWGHATATRDGKPLTDPITGATSFNAHFMVTKESMLESGTFKIYKSDRTSVFDPKTPGDGYVFAGRNEMHFALWGANVYTAGIAHRAGPPVTLTASDAVTGPTYERAFPIPIAAIMDNVAIDVAVSGGAGNLAVALKDPSGALVSSATLTPVAPAASLAAHGPLKLGNYTLDVSGEGVQASYAAKVVVTPPDPFLLHVVFTGVTLGETGEG
ncbi:MAG: hypothetical protein ACYDCK_04885 [Thermoplasmatota archaeon]